MHIDSNNVPLSALPTLPNVKLTLLEFSSMKHCTVQTTVIALTTRVAKEVTGEIFPLASEVKTDKIANFHWVLSTMLLNTLYGWWDTLTLTLAVCITTSHAFAHARI